MRLRRKTSLHILPTLVNLEWDDQLNQSDAFIPFWGAKYNGAYPSISSVYELFDDPFSTCAVDGRHVAGQRLVDACCCRTSWKLLNVVRYSLCHSLQKSSACFCRILNSFVKLPFVSGSGPYGITLSLSPIRKCAGVNAPASSACTMGLELMAASIATRVVFRPSSETCSRPSTLRRQRFVVPIILSHHPYQAALGAINFQPM